MKKIISLFLSALMLLTMLVSCGGGANATKEIAVITDVGILMDGGFNQGTWEGAKEYANSKGISIQYYQPANGENATDNDRIAAMRQAIQNGGKVILVVGFLHAKAIETVAKENPETKFVFVDGWTLGLDNVTAISYKEEESGYMAGYSVVKDGYTKLGGVYGGGGSNPAVNRYAYGFLQGVAAAAKENQKHVEVKYSYKYGGAFSGSTELQAQMSSWYADGTEVVFSCGGSMFQSVKSAAEETINGKIIGVDVDQSTASERVITSAIKGLGVSVKKVLGEYYNGEWDAKLKNSESKLGVNDDATGITIDTSKFNKFTKAEYDKLLNDLKSAKVKIKTDMPDDCNNAEWVNKAFANNEYIKIIFEK